MSNFLWTKAPTLKITLSPYSAGNFLEEYALKSEKVNVMLASVISPSLEPCGHSACILLNDQGPMYKQNITISLCRITHNILGLFKF